MCYGGPLFVAVVYIFINTPERGRIYGPATVNTSRDEDRSNHQTPNPDY